MPVEFSADGHLKRRGYSPEDERFFRGEGLQRLQTAQVDLQWLLDRGYGKKGALELVGRHYQLTVRQQMALQRSTDPIGHYQDRLKKQTAAVSLQGQSVWIDGLNVIITLEVLLAQSPVLFCRDGVYRDLAGLRGSYHLIAQTDQAIDWVLDCLDRFAVANACFFLDAPVANSGRLKSRILERSRAYLTPVEVLLVHNADASLEAQPRVISGDSIVLDRCQSWYNLVADILANQIFERWIIDLSGST